MRFFALPLALALLLFAAASGYATMPEGHATAQMTNAAGEDLGTVHFIPVAAGTLVRLDLKNMPAGTRAMHIHQTGECVPPFTTAGGHYNPDGKDHGFRAAHGSHAGDFPNLTIPQTGAVQLELLNTRLILDERMFDQDGASLIIHEAADDYESQPAGNAGGRYACGVIVRSGQPEREKEQKTGGE